MRANRCVRRLVPLSKAGRGMWPREADETVVPVGGSRDGSREAAATGGAADEAGAALPGACGAGTEAAAARVRGENRNGRADARADLAGVRSGASVGGVCVRGGARADTSMARGGDSASSGCAAVLGAG